LSEQQRPPLISGLKIDIYHDFDSARSSWQQFETACSHYAFQSYDWLSSWYKYIGQYENRRPCLVAVYAFDKPLILLPLVIQRQHGLNILSWAGGIITDYQAPLLAAEAGELSADSWQTIWHQIKTQLPPFDAARFLNQPEKVEGINNPFLLRGKLPYADSFAALPGTDWESYYQTQVKKRIRQDSRRQRKRLAEKGAVQFRIAREAAEIERFTEAMMEQKQRRYQETGVPDLLADPHYRQFYLQGGLQLSDSGKAHICALLVDEEIVATHWGICQGKRFYFLMPTYAGGDWKRYSPGRILLEELMQWCIAEGYEVFDFSLGGEQYKLDWCNQQMPLYETLDANSLRGQLYLLAQGLKRRLLDNPAIYRQAMKLRTWLHNR